MRKSDLAEILSVLNEEERARFQLYLQSPLYVEPQLARVLMRCLEIQCKLLEAEPSEQEEYNLIFSNEKFVVNKLGKLKSDLLKELRNWIFLEGVQKKFRGQEQHLILADYFLDKKLTNHYQRSKKQLDNWCKDQGQWLPNQYARLIEIAELEARYSTWHDYTQVPAATYRLLSSLDTHYAFARFYHYLLLESYSQSQGIDYANQKKQVQEMFKWSGFEPFRQTAHGFIIDQILQIKATQLDPKEHLQAVFRLKEMLLEKRPALHPWVFRNFIGTLFNMANSAGAEGRYLQWELQKIRTENTLEHPNLGLLHENEFLGVVNTAMLLGETEWVKWLIKASDGKIEGESDSQEVRAYASAFIAYAEGKHEDALQILFFSHFSFNHLKLNAKLLEVQVLFDSNSDLLDSRVEALKVYVFREKNISETNKEAATNFANIVKRLIRPGNTFQAKQLDRVLADAQSYTHLARRAWLEQTIQKALEKAQ